MSRTSEGIRVGLLMAGAGALLFWVAHHTGATSADGLRYIREAQQIARGDLAGGLLHAIDHPMHPLAVASVHAVFGGDDPFAWQTAAQAAATAALMLAVVPIVLLARELFDDDRTTWLAAVLVLANPVVGLIGVNVLSESTFLLFWTWGLWASARFLREGRFGWLPPAIGFGALAYLTRPEGMLIHLALVATLLLLPLHRVTRIHWPRWCAAVALLVLGPAILVGPYIATKGSLGTKPAVARVLGIMPRSPADALEREKPLRADQTAVEAYAAAGADAIRALQQAVTWPLIPLVLLGLFAARSGAESVRLKLFLGVIVAASLVGLMRLDVAAGYCSPRHALVPAVLLVMTAARGLSWIIELLAVDGRRLGLGEGLVRPGPAIWGLAVAMLAAWPWVPVKTAYQSSYLPYRLAGAFLAAQPDADGRVLDLTDWTLFFSGRNGRGYEAAGAGPEPSTRWLVVGEAQLANADNRAGAVARGIVDGREPAARFPDPPNDAQPRVLVYDLAAPRAIAHAAETPGRVR